MFHFESYMRVPYTNKQTKHIPPTWRITWWSVT